jgi:hypothetical protein
MFGGTTLGLASLLGGVAGATAQVIRYYGSKISRMFSSETAKEVSVPDEIIILLTARAFSLISEFSKVGHAQSSFTDEIFQKVDFDINLTATMQKARYHEEFCLLNGKNKTSGKREEFLEKLQAELLEIYQKANS